MTEESRDIERTMILEMLKDGKVDAEQAEKLLKALGKSRPKQSVQRKKLYLEKKFLIVNVQGDDGETVDVKVPLKLLQTGIKLSSLMPKNVRDKMESEGVDLSQLDLSEDGDELVEALQELEVTVNDPAKNAKVRVYCE
ncbi:MAG: hypothetical protein U5N86_11105 [Planctomycetota bacterium]|nr:hypothetical protein [Planctomycetota bacterium]